jgi:hypothetical protein
MAKIAERQDKLGNLIKSEYGTHFGFCRITQEAGASIAGEDLVGTIVALVDGELVAYDGTDDEGAEVIYGIVIEDKAIAEGDDTVVLFRGPANVAAEALKFTGTASVVHAALEAKGIKVSQQI